MGRKKKIETVICKHCGALIKNKTKYCTVCGTKLKSSILLFFLVMLPLFLCVFLTTNMSALIYNIISGYKYGQDFLVETIFAFIVLIVTLASGNSYIFTQKKENLFKSLLPAWPLLLIAFVNLLSSIMSLSTGGINIFNIFNLILFCCAIGVYEEFLCRGWLFNEFLERFGHTKKQVLLSIILSSLIFGGIHFINYFTTSQGLLVTLAQIIQASASGMLLASLYYRNKNIWSVILLHAFYDFVIFLGSSTLIKDCTTGTISSGMSSFLITNSILIAIFFILSTIAVLRKSDRWNELPSKKKYTKKTKSNLLVNVAIIIVFLFILSPDVTKIEGYDKYEICYNYEEIKIKNYQLTEYSLDKYEIKTSKTITIKPDINDTSNMMPINKTEHFNLAIYIDDALNVVLENSKTKDKVILNKDDEYISDVVLYEDDSYYGMAYYVDHVSGSTAYYAKISKSSIDNTKEYLNKIKDSIIAIELPTIERIGSLEVKDKSKKYIYMYSTLGDLFVIDEDGNIYLKEK